MDFVIVGGKRCEESGKGHNTSLWYYGLGKEEYYVCYGGNARADALCESAEIFGKGTDPHVFVGSVDEMAIIKGAASDFFHDGIAFTVSVLLDRK